MAKGDIDVCLGNWMPTMEADIASYRKVGRVETAHANLEGAKYALTNNKDAFGLSCFKVKESSEQDMLAPVSHADRRK